MKIDWNVEPFLSLKKFELKNVKLWWDFEKKKTELFARELRRARDKILADRRARRDAKAKP